jgi:hypothetical protein
MPGATGRKLTRTAKSLADDVVKAEEDVYKRTFTAEQRRQLASEGKALSDGSYPIETVEDLDNAASLARSGHGNVAGAKALIARRAKALGVPNPLDDDGKSSKSVADIAEQETTVDDVTQGDDGQIAKAVEAAVTKALEPLHKRVAELESANKAQADELAKVKATPIPGGPVLSANARPQGAPQVNSDLIAKAEDMRRKADQAINPADAAGYRQYARQLDEQARAAVTD